MAFWEKITFLHGKGWEVTQTDQWSMSSAIRASPGSCEGVHPSESVTLFLLGGRSIKIEIQCVFIKYIT